VNSVQEQLALPSARAASGITPLILTYNEAPNIRRTLEQLSWASGIVVVDSFSQDETPEIVRSFPTVRLLQRTFDSHAAQWNFGAAASSTDWVLALDADYVLCDALVAELKRWTPRDDIAAYFAPLVYCIHGRPLRGSLYPPRAVLFHRGRCRYVQDGHTQILQLDGTSARLNNPIYHDDRKSLARWFWAQDRYADLEADKLLSADPASLSFPDRLRLRIIPAAFLVFFYTLFAKRTVLDGWPGWYYALQRTMAEIILSLKLAERKILRNRNEK
jgi:glycosyltransferase involved in cell wall biosynthesis